MKIEKTIENSRIKLEVTDLPEIPKNTLILTEDFCMVADGKREASPEVFEMKLGEFCFLVPDSSRYQITDSAQAIAEALTRRFDSFANGYTAWVEKHTETAETSNDKSTPLQPETRLFYRNRKGEITLFDI